MFPSAPPDLAEVSGVSGDLAVEAVAGHKKKRENVPQLKFFIYPLVMTIPGKLMVFYGDLMGINGI